VARARIEVMALGLWLGREAAAPAAIYEGVVSYSVTSKRKKTTTPTSGPGVTARQERVRARRLRPVG
jgi:hypothetical protein